MFLFFPDTNMDVVVSRNVFVCSLLLLSCLTAADTTANEQENGVQQEMRNGKCKSFKYTLT